MPAWGAGLYLASALIAGLELTSSTAGCGLRCTFAVADAIPPLAKLAFGALLCAFMLLARHKRPLSTAAAMLRDAAAGAVAAAMVAELLRGGFGIAFLDSATLPVPNVLYVVGGALGGALGTLLERSCLRNLTDQ